MAEVQYFVCSVCEDGGADINAYTEDELKDLLSWDDDEKCIGMKTEHGCDEFLDLDGMDFGIGTHDRNACVIIRGEVVIPKEQKTVVEFVL